MRKPVSAATPEEQSRRRRRRLLGVVAVVVTVVAIVGAALSYVLLQPGAPLDLLGVRVTPDPAVPDQPLTVTAQVQGGTFLAPLGVSVQYDTFFGTGPSGTSTLFHGSGESYSATVGPFSNGSVLWLIVMASDGRRFEVFGNLTVVVGTLAGEGSSGLRINTVVLNPPHPTSLDVPTLTVNATSSADITRVYLSARFYSPTVRSSAMGGTSGDMMPGTQGNYTTFPGMLYGNGPVSSGTTVGTIWFYRVGVQDSAGAAVLSPVYTFTVALPPL